MFKKQMYKNIVSENAFEHIHSFSYRFFCSFLFLLPLFLRMDIKKKTIKKPTNKKTKMKTNMRKQQGESDRNPRNTKQTKREHSCPRSPPLPSGCESFSGRNPTFTRLDFNRRPTLSQLLSDGRSQQKCPKRIYHQTNNRPICRLPLRFHCPHHRIPVTLPPVANPTVARPYHN